MIPNRLGDSFNFVLFKCGRHSLGHGLADLLDRGGECDDDEEKEEEEEEDENRLVVSASVSVESACSQLGFQQIRKH